MANQRKKASPLIWNQKRKLKKSAKKFKQRLAITIISLTILLIVGCLLAMFLVVQISLK